jgi:hypothetical protein
MVAISRDRNVLVHLRFIPLETVAQKTIAGGG